MLPKMKVSWCFVILLATWTIAVEGQPSTKGFISIDCGADTRFKDGTGILYVSDDSYIDTGENYKISQNYISPSEQALTLRSFPNGTRNCYTLWNVTKGSKYLLRATFLHGNYDGKWQINIPLQFDLYLDISFWIRVNITDASRQYAHEVVTVAAHDFIWVCLVNINSGTPFISALELRPLKNYLYPYAFQNQSNAILFRLNYGPTENVVIRYPDDPYDRIWSWYQYDTTILTNISTVKSIEGLGNDLFEAPISVLQTALTPISSPNNLTTVSFDAPSGNANFQGYYAVLHIVELQELRSNQSRQFEIDLNWWPWYSLVTPFYLKTNYYYDTGPTRTSHNAFTFVQLDNSTLPPILNAMEIYWAMSMAVNPLTNANDVDAILAVKADYQIVRNWNGDPCSPTNLSWYGVSCSTNEPPQITSLNLSNFGLSGKISDSLVKLEKIVYLDLSHNNLTGDIPDSLASLSVLRVLNLSGNYHLSKHVPDDLLKRSNSGLLVLVVDSCTDCLGKDTSGKKISSTVIIVIVVAAVAITITIMALFLLIRRTKSRGSVEQTMGTQVDSEIRKFTYQELKDITNDFSSTIGRGGSGVVYHGYLGNQTEVAVKVCTQGSGQENKQFLAEVKSLSLVHHKHIVTLVGYCDDGDNLAVVYEYMPRGSLFDHLRGKESNSESFNWRMRLNIMLEAAQALDYLHTGCGIVHRDVKSSNILLSQNFEAKLSDLGLARVHTAGPNYSLMTLSGTPGYIDPEYQKTFKMNEKSDVYSFGVVLLEIITGEPPLTHGRENIHIIKLVKQMIARGNIEDVIDSRLECDCDVNSVWKVVELAMRCTSEESNQRPTMTDVVMHLKDSLKMEEYHQKEKLQQSGSSDRNTGGVSTSLSVSWSLDPVFSR